MTLICTNIESAEPPELQCQITVCERSFTRTVTRHKHTSVRARNRAPIHKYVRKKNMSKHSKTSLLF